MYIASYSAEEYERYVVTQDHTLNQTYYMTLGQLATKDGAKSEDKALMGRLMGSVTQYMYLESRYGNRPLTISGCFNPYFVLGYPCVAFDGQMVFMAKPMSVTHTLNAGGSASTTYMCRFAVDFDKTDLMDETATKKHTKFPPLPGWLPDAYFPYNIDATYASILGRNKYKDAALGGEITPNSHGKIITAAMDDSTGVSMQRVNIAMLANSVFSLDRSKPSGKYDLATDKAEFARDYVMRGVTTVKQYGEFYNTDLSTNDAPKLKFPKMDLFKHVEDIASGVRVDNAFTDKDKQKTQAPSEYIDDKVKTKEEGSVDITAGYHKYDKMEEIQKEIFNTGFRG
jgi:hypothetical protein